MSLGIYCEGECAKNLVDYAQRSSPPPFLLKTHMVVEDPSKDSIISWNEKGTTFVVWKTTDFARDILPTLFKHNNFSSFVRQLNTYGFRKVTSGRWEFHNDMFRRGESELLCEIRRRKAWTSKIRKAPAQTPPQDSDDDDRGSSSTSSSSDYEVLCNENNRLKRENSTLCFELANMKNKCKELLDLITLHTNLEKKEVDERPKLFGVRLEVGPTIKKTRVEIDESIRILLSPPCKSGSF